MMGFPDLPAIDETVSHGLYGFLFPLFWIFRRLQQTAVGTCCVYPPQKLNLIVSRIRLVDIVEPKAAVCLAVRGYL
jgi:hypothetical protein